jgi:hypothetical protein
MRIEKCELNNCEIVNYEDLGEVQEQELMIYNNVYYNRLLKADNTLIIKDCILENVKIGGFYDYFCFQPQYCKNVEFMEDFFAKEMDVKINCLITAGIKWENMINKFLAGLLLLNDEIECLISPLQIQKYRKKFKKILDNLEPKPKKEAKCQQKVKSKKD